MFFLGPHYREHATDYSRVVTGVVSVATPRPPPPALPPGPARAVLADDLSERRVTRAMFFSCINRVWVFLFTPPSY